MDIQQGNSLSQANIKQLHKGMNKTQVLTLLGDPLINNGVDSNRMDYIYTLQKKGGPIHEQKLTLRFKNGLLSDIQQNTYSNH